MAASLVVFAQAINYLNENSFGYPGSENVITKEPSDIFGTKATLNGVSSLTDTTQKGFEYGQTNSYGQTTVDNSSIKYGLFSTWNIRGAQDGQFDNPWDGATDSSGNVYVLDKGNNRVQKFDSSGNYISKWGSLNCNSPEMYDLCFPEGIAVDSNNNVYVSDRGNGRIVKYSSSGVYITAWNSRYANDVAIDSNDNVFVIEYNGVKKLDSNGTVVSEWGSYGCAYNGPLSNGAFCNPDGLAIDSNGNVYVGDQSNYRVQKFDNNGNYILQWGQQGYGDNEFQLISGISVLSSGNIAVLDRNGSIVREFDNTGTFVQRWNVVENDTYGIFTDDSGAIYVTASSPNKIIKFDSSGTKTDEWGSKGSSYTNAGSLSNGISADNNGNVYAVDQDNNRIQKFDSNGIFITEWGEFGYNNDQFFTLCSVAADQSGNVFTYDLGNSRISKYDSNGQLLTSWSTPYNNLCNKGGLTTDQSGNVYWANNSIIYKYQTDGTEIAQIGYYESGTCFDQGNFCNIKTFSIASSGNIYVFDANTQNGPRIIKLNSSGTYVTEWGSVGNGDGQFWYPENSTVSMTVDQQENIYVTDINTNRIQKFNSSGTFITKWYKNNGTNFDFDNPSTITVDSENNFYIADRNHSRIQKFATGIESEVTGLQCGGTTYHYRAFATNGNGTQFGADQEFVTGACVQSPQDLFGTPRTQSVNLEWGYVSNIYNYEVDYKKTSDENWTEFLDDGDRSISNDNVTVAGLESGVSYDFRVRAVNDDGDRSDWSQVFTVSTRVLQTYHITNCVELQAISINPLTFEFGDSEGRYILDNDIDCTESASWTWEGLLPPGYESPGFLPIMDIMGDNPFSGSIDGQGFAIKNLYQNAGNIPLPSGIIGVTDGAIFENIAIEDSSIVGSASGFGTSGSGFVNTAFNTTFNNVQVKGLSLAAPTYGAVGGLVAMLQNSTLNNVSVTGTVTTRDQNTDGKFNNPSGIAVDADGNIHVADSDNNRIQKFNASGQYLSQFGVRGSGDGQLDSPSSIAVDVSGNIFVTDTDNNRVQKFNASGQYLLKFGSYGSGDGQFSAPRGLDTDSSGNVYVVDSYNNRVQKFDASGQYLSQFGSNGSNDGELSYPAGVALDSFGNILVADSQNYRVQKFDASGQYLSQFGSNGSDDGQFYNIRGIAVDASNNVYVTDIDNDRVQKFNSNGSFNTKWGIQGYVLESEIANVGGVAGVMVNDPESQFTISKVYSDVSIDIEPFKVQGGVNTGGIAGAGGGSSSNTYSKGSILVNGLNQADTGYITGGLYGSYFGSIENSYASGSVSIQNANNPMILTGGLAGNLASKDFAATLRNSFSTASVSAPDGVFGPAGGLLGIAYYQGQPLTVENNYYDQTATSRPQCIGAALDNNDEPLSLPSGACTTINASGNQSDYFVNSQSSPPLDQWNFDTIWKINSGSLPTFLGSEAPVPTIPGAPRNLAASNASFGSIDLSWLVPSSIGNSAITDYIVQYKLASSGTWLTYSDGVGVSTSTSFGDLTIGQQYDFKVAAVNAIGQGAFTNPVTAEVVGIPSAPQNVSVTDYSSGDVSLVLPQLEWDAPLQGAPITDYVIQYKKVGSSSWSTFTRPASTDRLALVDFGLSGLQEIDFESLTQEEIDAYIAQYEDLIYDIYFGAQYQLRVAAVNNVGMGSFSDPVDFKFGLTASNCTGLYNLLSSGVTRDGYEVDFGSGPEPLPQLSIIMTQDIDCSETVNWNSGTGWTPIGDDEYYFAGNFDGRGYKIEDIFIDQSAETNQASGIFNQVKRANIQDVDIAGGTVKGGGTTGSLAGFVSADTVIDNVQSSADVSGLMVGGLVGVTSQDGNIQVINSNFSGSVWGSEITGGLIGFALTGDLSEGEFRASSTVVDASGNVYIAGDQMIQKFDASGNYQKRWGNTDSSYDYGYANAEGQFSGYSDVKLAIDSQNNIYATDSRNSRIQKFNSNGEFLLMIGGTGPNSYPAGSGYDNGEFNSFDLRIVVDSSDNLYVLDTGNDRVQKFNSSGVFVSTWGSTGVNDGQFVQPKDIAIDNANNIYVYSERDGSYGSIKIQKFSSSGSFIYSVGAGSGDQALVLDGQLPYKTMAFDQANNLLVLDQSKVKVFDSSGNFVRAYDTQYGASAITVDSAGNSYVTSSYSSSNLHNGVQGSLVKFSSTGDVLGSVARSSLDPELLGPSWDVWLSQNGNVNVVSGDNKEAVKTYTSDLTFVSKFDGTENNNAFVTEVSDATFSGSIGQPDNGQASLMIGGGIIGASGEPDFLSNTEVSFTSMFLGASTEPNIVIKRSQASIDFGDECMVAGGIIGASYTTQVKLEDSSSTFNINCSDTGQILSANGGLVGMTVGGVDIVRSTATATINSQIEPGGGSSDMSLVASGGLIGAQFASLGGINIVDSTSSGSINVNSQVNGLSSIGGLVGLASNKETVLQDSSSAVNITADSTCSYGCYVGGLMGTSGGFIGDGTGFGGTVAVYSSQSTGNISVDSNAFAVVGGASGLILNGVAIFDNFSRSGQVSVSGGLGAAGGIAGVSYAPETIVSNAKISGNVDVATQDVNVSNVTNYQDYKLGIGGGMFGVLAAAQADVSKSYVSGDVSSPLLAGGVVGITVGLDVNLNAILGLDPGMLTSPPAGISDIIGPGTIDISNSYVSGNVSTKSLKLLLPTIPPVTAPDGSEIQFPENPEISFGGFAGGMVAVGANTNIKNSYVSGDVSTGNGGINFDVKGFMASQVSQAPPGTFSEDLLDTLDTLIDVGETLLRGASGGMAGFYFDRAPTDGSYDDFGIENTFVAGKISSYGQKGSIVGMTPSYVLSYFSDSVGSFRSPQKVAVDSVGNSYVVDLEMNRVQKFDINGEYISEFGEEGSGNGQFDQPRGVAINDSGDVFVADYGNHRIQKFDSDGNFISQWATEGIEVGQPGYPGDIDFDSNGNLFVADLGNSVIQKYSSSGVFITSWGVYGTDDGELRSPSGIAVDSSNSVFVADTGNNRIQKFDANGNYLSQFGIEGTGDGQFYAPRGVSFDSDGSIYVADTNSHRIQKFTSAGEFVASWGEYGSDDGKFNAAQDVDAGPSGMVYTVDSGNHRIQKFTSAGEFIGKWGRIDNQSGVTEFSVEGNSDISNTFYDKTLSELNSCGQVLELNAAVVMSQSTDIAQSVNVGDLPDGSCTPVNENNTQPNYFKNNTNNAPLNQWNFSTIWKTNYNALPDFIGSTAPTPPTPPPTPPTTPTTPPTPTTPRTPSTPSAPATPTTPAQPSSDTPITPSVQVPQPVRPAPLKRESYVRGSFIGSLINQVSRIPRPIAATIPFSILALLIALAALYSYSAGLERRRREQLQSLISRIQSTTGARRTYLQLTSHYINTPIAKMQGVIELLAMGVGGTSKSSSSSKSSSLAITTPTMTVPEDLVVGTRKQLDDLTKHAHELLEQAQTESPLQTAMINDLSRLKGPALLTRPAIWVPVAIILTTTAAINFLFIQADRYDGNLINYGVQVGVALVGVIAIVVSYYFLQKFKSLRHMTQKEFDTEQSLAKKQQIFIAEAHEKLSQDLLVLTQLGVGIARYPHTDGFIVGRIELTHAVSKLEQLNMLSKQDSSTLEPISVHEQVEKMKDQMQPLAIKQKVTITIHEDPGLTVAVSEPTFLHLLSAPVKNAILASPENSEIVLDITKSKKAKQHHAIRIKVTDHGSGIAPDKLEVLFKPFSTVASPEQFTDSGFGLDLYFVKLLCEQYQGDVKIRSSEGEGTVVSITI